MPHQIDGFKIGTAAASLDASYAFYFGKRKPMTVTPYQQRVNAANLAAQTDPVQVKAREILKKLGDAERAVYWAIEPGRSSYEWCDSLIENAHALLDLAHEYKAGLTLNPPPRVEDEEEAS